MVRVGKFALSATVAAQLLLRMDVTLMLGVPRTWSAAFQAHPTIYWQSPQDMYHHNHYHYIGTITASSQIEFHLCSARCYIRCREKTTNAERSKRPYPPPSRPRNGIPVRLHAIMLCLIITFII